ncbi:MAG: hypothetical protein IT428_04385, partial [Planctomycetaceae bacterium]|nr:hypothetical protein [Planctomycetaceae bacterium]
SKFIVKLRELQEKKSKKSEWVTVGKLGPFSSAAQATAEKSGWEKSGENRRGFVEEIP